MDDDFLSERKFHDYGGGDLRNGQIKPQSEMRYKTSYVSILRETFLENIKKGQGRDFSCLI